MTTSSLLCVAFISGLATSFGPCLVPRYLALAAQISSGANGMSIVSFLCGCIAGYIAFAGGAAVVTVLQASSRVMYAVAATILVAAGLRALLVAGGGEHDGFPGTCQSLGARFVGGLCCSIFGAPCCVPVALALGVQSSAYDAGFGAITLGAFGAGQALPLAVMAAASRVRLPAWMQMPAEIPATVGGTVLIAIGALFGAVA